MGDIISISRKFEQNTYGSAEKVESLNHLWEKPTSTTPLLKLVVVDVRRDTLRLSQC